MYVEIRRRNARRRGNPAVSSKARLDG
jgi:hypothetical protein